MIKPALPVWSRGVPIDPGIQKALIILHSFIHLLRYIHIYDIDLPQSFHVACLIDNRTHTLALRSYDAHHIAGGKSDSNFVSYCRIIRHFGTWRNHQQLSLDVPVCRVVSALNLVLRLGAWVTNYLWWLKWVIMPNGTFITPPSTQW